MSRARTTLPLLTALLLAAPSAPVFAQGEPKAEAASLEADAFFREGKEAYKKKDVQGAFAAYSKAWERKRTWDIATNLAGTEALLGLHAAAANHYTWAIRNFPPSGIPAHLEETQRRFEASKSEAGGLLLEVSPASAEVRVDAQVIERPPPGDAHFVPPGRHRVEASGPGFVVDGADVDAAKGQVATVRLTLVAEAQPAGPTGPDGPGAAAAGASGPSGATGDSGAAAGWPDKTLVSLVGGGVAAAAAVGGVVMVVLSNGQATDAEELRASLTAGGRSRVCGGAGEPADCASLRETLSAKDQDANAALWLFVGAGVAGLGTAGYVLFAPEAEPPKSGLRAVSPWVSAEGSGLWLEGSF
jgi:hypothetical protein